MDVKSIAEVDKWDIDDLYRYHAMMLYKRDYEKAMRAKCDAKREEA